MTIPSRLFILVAKCIANSGLKRWPVGSKWPGERKQPQAEQASGAAYNLVKVPGAYSRPASPVAEAGREYALGTSATSKPDSEYAHGTFVTSKPGSEYSLAISAASKPNCEYSLATS